MIYPKPQDGAKTANEITQKCPDGSEQKSKVSFCNITLLF